MNLELLLTRHAKKFVGGKDARAAIQGITYSGNYAYATNSHILLRVGSPVERAEPEIRSLTGKPIGETPINMERLIPYDPVAAIVNVKEMLDAVKLMRGVLKTVKGGLVTLQTSGDESGDYLIIGINEIGNVSGTIKVNGKFNTPFSRKVNVEYLYNCLMVFSKDFETVEILAADNNNRPLTFMAGEVLTLLLPVRWVD